MIESNRKSEIDSVIEELDIENRDFASLIRAVEEYIQKRQRQRVDAKKQEIRDKVRNNPNNKMTNDDIAEMYYIKPFVIKSRSIDTLNECRGFFVLYANAAIIYYSSKGLPMKGLITILGQLGNILLNADIGDYIVSIPAVEPWQKEECDYFAETIAKKLTDPLIKDGSSSGSAPFDI